MGKHLEIHSIYILIPEYSSLKQSVKYCDRYRWNTVPGNVALRVEVVAVKLQKHLGSVRWPMKICFIHITEKCGQVSRLVGFLK